ncbi:plasmid pRiA4b ORF-3 family protein [Moorellaceae bacterium AZ2]
MPSRSAPTSIYQLKITLKGIKPPIWRRVQVPGNVTLYKLHKIIQVVMDWGDYHLYEFRIGDTYYGIPDPDFEELHRVKSARSVKLNQVVPSEGFKFLYVYDFGDNWQHEIVVEKILPPVEGMKYPICLDGRRASPPEDCGGIGGYYEMLRILRDPEHEEYEETLQWLGGSFDPEAFDLEIINEVLRRLR